MKTLLPFLMLFVFSASTGASNPGASHVEGQANLPVEVGHLVDRIVDCNHWLGEPPYDEARANAIKAAVVKLRCDALAEEKAAMLRKHSGDPAVIRAVRQADGTVL